MLYKYANEIDAICKATKAIQIIDNKHNWNKPYLTIKALAY
jgi:hypothetical protein